MTPSERELSERLARRFEPEPTEWTSAGPFEEISAIGWWERNQGYYLEPRSYREPDRVVWMLKKLLEERKDKYGLFVERAIYISAQESYSDAIFVMTGFYVDPDGCRECEGRADGPDLETALAKALALEK